MCPMCLVEHGRQSFSSFFVAHELGRHSSGLQLLPALGPLFAGAHIFLFLDLLSHFLCLLTLSFSP